MFNFPHPARVTSDKIIISSKFLSLPLRYLMGRKKQRTISLEEDILKILTEHRGRILNHKQIFSRLALEDMPRNAEAILPVLEKLVQDGSLGRKDKYKFYRLLPPVTVEGVVDITRQGRIFLMVEGQEDDLVVVQSHIRLLPFDRVNAVIVRQGKKNTKAEVISLVAHSQKQYTGILEKFHHHWYVLPDNQRFQYKFSIKHEEDFREGRKLVFKIREFRKDNRFPTAELVELLGKPGEHHTEMHAILAEFGLPEAFSPEVQRASDAISEFISKEDLLGREDYRKVLTFTIDPETAKDFDDAISYQHLDNGNLEVGVHIADVSHYVKPGTILDREALNRATSVYLVDRVVPMLPFKLSDVVCSLVPNQDRLTFAAIFEIDSQFNVVNKRFVKSIIHSDKRFSYEEAQSILDAGKGVFHDQLKHLNAFAKHLAKQRFEKGAMSFESNEYRFVLDDQLRPIDMKVKIRQDTNKMIEELMLLANRSVAQFIYSGKPRKPFIYRTHDEPSDMKLQELKRFLAKFGYNLQIDNEQVFRKSINEITKSVEGKPEQDLVRNMSIRSMAKAVYTPNKPSHFGLAFPYYTHFTSPIRRYPDVIAHRLLHGYLQGQSMEQICSWNMERLDAACKQSSQMEIQASEAERASIKYKQAEWMESQLGKVFTGVISGLTDFGIFVEIKEFKCEGMVRLNQIPGDRYEYDSYLMAVIGNRFFKQFKMGDEVQVMVAATDKIRRTIDLELIFEDSPRKKQHGRKHRHIR